MGNKFITSRQHGFRPGHSCETQLICNLDNWTSALELGHQVDVIYLDLQKAFDKVPHARLLHIYTCATWNWRKIITMD